MKTARFIKMTAWALALILAVSCSSTSGLGRHSGRMQDDSSAPRKTRYDKSEQRGQKNAKVQQTDNTSQKSAQRTAASDTLSKEAILGQVVDNAQTGRFITSKIKFSVEVGNRQMTLTGNLKMKRDDVIRLQLMAFGFVEAGRLEFTKDYVLIVDRINKQFLKVPYAQLDFLRNSNIDFNTLQALFWNELYQPSNPYAPKGKKSNLQAEAGADDDVILSTEDGMLSYRWLTESKSARIKMTNIKFSDPYKGNYQLNWDYDEFKAFDRKFFPTRHMVTFTTPDKEVKFNMKLNYMGKDEDWETRTELSGKYRQMPVDEILRRFMSL